MIPSSCIMAQTFLWEQERWKGCFHSACCGAGIGTEAAYQSVGQHRNSQGTNVIRDHIGTSLQISIGLDTA